MSATYTCDKCGKKLQLNDVYTVTLKRVCGTRLPQYMFCEECSCHARALIDAFVYAKGEDDG